MTAGLEVFDGSGNLLISDTTNVGSICGHFQTGAANGSITDSRLNGRNPLVFCYPSQTLITQFGNSYFPPPVFTLSGSVLSWTFDSRMATSHYQDCTVVYGFF